MMNESRNNTIYFNTPTLPESMSSPASVVGIALVEKEDATPVLEFIVRRDREMPLASFTVAYRYTAAPIGMKDAENPFHKMLYNKDDINDKDYLILRCAVPEEGLRSGVSAVICSATASDGKVVMYRPRDFVDPEIAMVGGGEDAAAPLKEYLSYRSASFMKKLSGGYDTDWLDDGYFKETAETSVTAADRIGYRLKKAIKPRIVGIVTTIVVLALIVVGAVVLVNKIMPENVDSAALPVLMEEKRYAEAYKIIHASGESEQLQELCREASSHYLSLNDYENAYLYAVSAPTPFDAEVIELFAAELLKEDRFEEAYEFVKARGNYAGAMQLVCESAVDGYLLSKNYVKAYYFAGQAPEPLLDKVVNRVSAFLNEGGTVDAATFAILDSMEDSEKYDGLARDAVDRAIAEKDYVSAANIASKIRNGDDRDTLVKDICNIGAIYYIDNERLADAATVIEESAEVLGDGLTPMVQAMADYCLTKNGNAGTLYFSNILGNDTSSYVIERQDIHVRNAASKVYFLLTEAQKRAYHANPFDLYKEAYLIKDGAVSGTNITGAVSVATSEYITIVLLSDGTVTSWGNNGHNMTPEIPGAVNIVQIDAGRGHYVLLHNSGKVYAYGENTYGQCGVRQWKDIVKVVAGADFTVGLCSDGTLRACGSNLSGQCNVDGYANVVDIAAADQTLFILFADGSVKTVGDVAFGLKKADGFTDVRRIRAAGNTVVAEKNDGTFLMASGAIGADCGNVSGWQGIDLFSAGSTCVGYVDENGNIIIKGDGAPVFGAGN